MHDVVIRGGTIVDGTGAPAFVGDVALDGDRIAQVGGKAGPARREVQAEGRLVTPGWVDVHTHYDGQATWDPVLAPSSWHGATSCRLPPSLPLGPLLGQAAPATQLPPADDK